MTLARAAFAVVLALALVLAACGGGGGDAEPTPTAIATTAPTAASTAEPTEPAVQVPNVAPAASIELPLGFAAYPVASGFAQPTSVSVAVDGKTYVSERTGNVYRLIDADGDGVFEENRQFASGFNEVTGILATQLLDPGPIDAVYVSSRGRVTIVRDPDGDGVGDAQEDVITGLPNGRHQNNGLLIGPDAMLYLTNGSTCDDTHDCPGGVEADERSGTILQANLDGSGLRVFASGLRNPYDITFDEQGRLWSTDNGSDDPCGSIDELNLIMDGEDFGWPYGEACDPFNDGIAPAASLGLHTASTGIDSYDAPFGGGHFPDEYDGNLFLTLWGSLAYDPELPPQLMRAIVEGESATVETFGTGFANPIDVFVDRDGTLLVLDFGTGVLYRILYTG